MQCCFFLPNQWFGFHFAVFKLSILILLNYAKYDIDLCHLNVRIMLHNPEAAGRTTQAGSFSSSSWWLMINVLISFLILSSRSFDWSFKEHSKLVWGWAITNERVLLLHRPKCQVSFLFIRITEMILMFKAKNQYQFKDLVNPGYLLRC